MKFFDGYRVKNSDIILILIAKTDHNGAFKTDDLNNLFKLHNQNRYKVIYREVSTISDIYSTIKTLKNDQNNRIKGLWIQAHGNPRGFLLNEKQKGGFIINTSSFNPTSYQFKSNGNGNVEELTVALTLLEKNAVILLDSCSTGRIDTSQDNRSIAQTIASLAPGRTVIAPTTIVSALSLKFEWKMESDDLLIGGKFINPKTARIKGLMGKIANLFYIIVYLASPNFYGENVTARYCSTYAKPESNS
jgi:hypothetical protein